MSDETAAYTPGHTPNATAFMAARGPESHGAFFTPLLRDGDAVLDCGCGPGTITVGVARRIPGGRVTGIDFGESQIEAAHRTARAAGATNVTFVRASCDALPFPDAAFDLVYSHALFEHLASPDAALAEIRRVLKPGGRVALCSPDWDGFVIAPETAAVRRAKEAYMALQRANGGDVNAGRKLGDLLASAGFRDIAMSARYECYPEPAFIGDYLALRLDDAGLADDADAFRNWSRGDYALFAQTWVSAVATR